jgi:hypothetical protein
MSDTLGHAEAYLEEGYSRLTPGRRIEMACGMWTTAVELARAGIRRAEPGLTEAEIRVRLVRRLYAQDLGSPAVETLIAAMEQDVTKQTPT